MLPEILSAPLAASMLKCARIRETWDLADSIFDELVRHTPAIIS